MTDNRARNGTLGAILGALIAVALAAFLLNGGEHVGKKTVNSDADLPGRDRREVCVAVDGLLTHVLATIEQECGESDSDRCAEDGAQFAVACPVVSHHHLRSS